MTDDYRKDTPLTKGLVSLLARLILLLALIVIAVQIAHAGQTAYYLQSPLPTPTFTPTPITPTNTPTPIPPTDTPTPIPPTDTPVPNSPPIIDSISGATEPVDVGNQPVALAVTFHDPDSGDTHMITWEWGDGSSNDVQPNAVSPAAQSHVYAEQGVYSVVVTVTDMAGAFDSAVYEFIVIFDATSGFVTGGGWYGSPAGAYKLAPELSGPANFGFVSRYKRGATVPEGHTQFLFSAGNLNFTSDSYDWLVITANDSVARFLGNGGINGSEPIYKFSIWAGDGNPDTFRIKIWLELPSGEIEIYDNGHAQPIDGGTIVIHTGT